jgi:hypothetical protein
MYLNNAFFSILLGNEAKAYAALGVLAAEVESEQPDTWMYLIHTPNLDPGVRHLSDARAGAGYVNRVRAEEPTTLMYTVSVADTSDQSMALPPSQHDALVYNSSWTDQKAFFDHGDGPPYQDFLKGHGDLFLQAGPGSTTHPYMTTSVLRRFAGFFRKEAFIP